MATGQTARVSPDGREGSTQPRATDLAYDRLSEAIITLNLAPGLMVNERSLSAKLGLTRLTLIPALHRLSEAGLVSVLPRRGILIAPVDVRDVQQVFEARIAIEGHLVELAAQRATLEQLHHLRTLSREIEDAERGRGAYRRFLELDRQLHLELAELGRNRFLYAALERVWMVNARLWHLFFTHHGTTDSYFLHHHDIIDAVEARDAAAARAAITDHIVASKNLLQRGLWE